MANDQLTYPLLPIPDLIEGFRRDLGPDFDIRENDFTQPSKERWVRLYCVLLAHMTDNDVDELTNRLRSVGHEYLDYSELYVETQLLMNLAKFMAKALLQCKFSDFTIEDIVRPTKKRLTIILSGVMNYIRFRVNRKEELSTIIQKMASRVDLKDALRKENEELAPKIEAIRKRQAEESEAVAKVLVDVEAAGARLDQLHRNNGMLKKVVDEVKLKIGKKQLDMQRRLDKIASVVAETAKLEEQIVTSPVRFEAEIRDYESRLARMQEIQAERSAHLSKLRKLKIPELKAEYQQAVKEISSELEKARATEQMTSELRSAKGRVHDLQERAEALQKAILKQKLAHAHKQEKLEKQDIICRKEEEAVELELRKLMTEEDKKKDLADEVENIQAQRQSVEIEKAEKTAEHEENMRYMYKVYASLLTAFETYNQNVANAMRIAIPEEVSEILDDIERQLKKG